MRSMPPGEENAGWGTAAAVDGFLELIVCKVKRRAGTKTRSRPFPALRRERVHAAALQAAEGSGRGFRAGNRLAATDQLAVCRGAWGGAGRFLYNCVIRFFDERGVFRGGVGGWRQGRRLVPLFSVSRRARRLTRPRGSARHGSAVTCAEGGGSSRGRLFWHTGGARTRKKRPVSSLEKKTKRRRRVRSGLACPRRCAIVKAV